MKIFNTILFCFLLFSSCQSTGTGSLIKIRDKENILRSEGGDGVWDPGVLDRVKLKNAIEKYLLTTTREGSIYFDSKYILSNFSKYTIEYAGIIDNSRKFISCQMILDFDEISSDPKGIIEASEFSMIFDGGKIKIK